MSVNSVPTFEQDKTQSFRYPESFKIPGEVGAARHKHPAALTTKIPDMWALSPPQSPQHLCVWCCSHQPGAGPADGVHRTSATQHRLPAPSLARWRNKRGGNPWRTSAFHLLHLLTGAHVPLTPTALSPFHARGPGRWRSCTCTSTEPWVEFFKQQVKAYLTDNFKPEKTSFFNHIRSGYSSLRKGDNKLVFT